MRERANVAPGPDDGVHELPLYVLEVEAPARSIGLHAHAASWIEAIERLLGPSPPWPTDRDPLGADRRGPTLVLSRVLPLPTDTSVAALSRWQSELDGPTPAPVADRRLRLGPLGTTSSETGCRTRARLRRRTWRASVPLELELLPWSKTRTELELRPSGRCRRVDHYFALANRVIDEVAAQIVCHAL
jgi:hypothetical protein